MTGDADDRDRKGAREGQTPAEAWQYLGVGCLTAISGLFAGGMIAVLVAKIVGGVRACPAELETGAPCNWFAYVVVGACIGLLAFPTTSILLLRRGRQRARNSERG